MIAASPTVAKDVVSARQSGTSRLNVNALLQAFVLLPLIGVILLYRSPLLSLSLADVGKYGIACSVLAVITVYRASSRGAWAPSTIYVSVLSIFHFGLSSVFALGLLSEPTTVHVARWFFRTTTVEAIYLSGLGVLACAAGVQIAHLRTTRNIPLVSFSKFDNQARLRRVMEMTGATIVVICVLGWYGVVLRSGGFGLLIAPYESYLRATAGSVSNLSFIWFGMGIGMSFIAASAHRSSWTRVALIAFLAFLLFALPLGLRGEVMFPSLTFLVILFRFRRPPSARITLLGVVAVLFAISLLQQIRTVGLGTAPSSNVNGNALDGLTELGSTLRPVSEVILWRQLGEMPISGASYLAPFDRPTCHIFVHSTCVPALNDPRLLNVLTTQRAGPIGFSPVAEAYRNFGTRGVIFVLGLVGLLLGWFDRRPATPIAQAAVGVIFVELLINVRNGFVAAPSHILIGFLIILFVKFYGNVFRSENQRG